MSVAPKLQTNQFDFIKMRATGNDFIIIDNRFTVKKLDVNLIKLMSQRHFIGCDQLIVISREQSDNIDAVMTIFNSDGSTSPTCGNATRCVAALLFAENSTLNKVMIKTSAGLLECFKISDDLIKVNLGAPQLIENNIKLHGYNFTHVNVGNPHAVTFNATIPADEDFFTIGKSVENNLNFFPHKTNVEFAKMIDEKTIEVRVFERGVGETLACGSGACAVAFAAIANHHTKNSQITIRFKGGAIIIEYDGKDVFMTASFEKIFSGVLEKQWLI